jgi:hypothetical protein
LPTSSSTAASTASYVAGERQPDPRLAAAGHNLFKLWRDSTAAQGA